MTRTPVAVPADRRDLALDRAFAGEIAVRAAIARKTDSEPPRLVCAWCPDFKPEDTRAGDSHGLCAACAARLHADLDRVEASR
jgi:hypothetical protein